jgi:hypothetical protein
LRRETRIARRLVFSKRDLVDAVRVIVEAAALFFARCLVMTPDMEMDELRLTPLPLIWRSGFIHLPGIYIAPAITGVVLRQGSRKICRFFAQIFLINDTVLADDERHDS